MISLLKSIAAFIRSKRPTLADELRNGGVRLASVPRVKLGQGRRREDLQRRGRI